MKTSALVIGLLFAESAQAINFRPYVNGRTPWYKTVPGVDTPDFPHDYAVANFGVDHDIKSSLTHTAAAEARLGEWKNAGKPPPGPPPRDYFVPNFGEDHDIKTTKSNTAYAEGRLGHELKASFAAAPSPPRDYFVPNFGVDHDIKETQKHASAAETGLGHKWVGAPAEAHPIGYFIPNFGEDIDVKGTKVDIGIAENQYKHTLAASFAQPGGPPRDYFVPNFGQDHEIKESLLHTANAEARLGAWNNAAAAPAGPPPRDYFVPNFGLDKDIKDSLTHTAATEAKLGHQMAYVQSAVDLHLESDPICSSAGCTQYKHKKKARGYDINYPVPNLGVDHEILDSHHSLKISEGALGHNLEMGTDASKAKWHNPAKDTDYNFAPKLEGDMVSTAKNLADAENTLGHKWVIDD